jgi:type IV pilus assembly protein PilW
MECNHATVNASQVILNTLGSPMAFDFRYGIGGYEAAGTSPGSTVVLPPMQAAGAAATSWTPNLDGAFGSFNQQVSGSDVLVVRSSLGRSTPAYTNAAVGNGASSFPLASATSLQGGQLAVISDCTKSIVFQISAIAGSTVNLGGATGPPGNSTAALPFGFSSGALVSPVTTLVYYIGLGADGDAALRRLELVNGTVIAAQYFTDEEIVPDIENMQVLYGVDTAGTQTVSAYMTADQVAAFVGTGASSFNSVMSVRVAVLAASPPGSAAKPATAPTFSLLGTAVKAPIDTRLRRVFDITITVRNSVS